MRITALALFLLPVVASAQVYKCPSENGGVSFSDRPCGGAAESPEHAVDLSPPPQIEKPATKAGPEVDWEEEKRYRYVEVPAIERQAAELIASGDPERVRIGKEMAWQAHQAKEAFAALERSRAARQETEERYERARRNILGRP